MTSFGRENEWHTLVAALEPRVVTARSEVARLPRRAAREPLSDELDEMSRADTAVELERHGAGVGARARAIAERLGIAPDLAAIVERAGRSHDLGKADPRFQRWLDPDGMQPVPVAKSRTPRSRWTAARIAAGWPAGGRHEALSAQLVRRWLEIHPEQIDPTLADLPVHLVVSHHGSGRPLAPPVVDDTPDVVCAEFHAGWQSIQFKPRATADTTPGRGRSKKCASTASRTWYLGCYTHAAGCVRYGVSGLGAPRRRAAELSLT